MAIVAVRRRLVQNGDCGDDAPSGLVPGGRLLVCIVEDWAAAEERRGASRPAARQVERNRDSAAYRAELSTSRAEISPRRDRRVARPVLA
jgi:hypothetical protein